MAKSVDPDQMLHSGSTLSAEACLSYSNYSNMNDSPFRNRILQIRFLFLQNVQTFKVRLMWL